ncbi:MAG TPA: hypothetical protein VK548_11680 [Candidatus Acidoferrum sp.]|nr:hypothetical protein [Candidatus Acidoferrum sp.]
MAYLRVATHPAIFEHPLSPDEAVSNLESLFRRPHVRVLSEDEGFWDVYRETTDGFRKFRFLDVRNPFD